MERKYNIDIKWLAVSSFELKFNNITVVTDPYITHCVGTDLTCDAVENCNIICLGHAHWDHITDIPQLCEKFKPMILCGDQTAIPLAKWLNYTPSYIYPMYPDLELDFDDVKIRALYGRHGVLRGGMGFNDISQLIEDNSRQMFDEGVASVQAVGTIEYRNFLFTTPDGVKILFWGNEPITPLVNICKGMNPDIAIIQRGVSEKAIVERAEFAAKLGCKVVIPHHHDFKAKDDPAIIEKFKEEFLKRVPDGEFITPVHGEWINL